MLKGNFLHPVLYRFAKNKNSKEFRSKLNINIRSSCFLKIFTSKIFRIHNGKYFVVNDPISLKILFKSNPYYNFKLGHFSYNRQVIARGRNNRGITIINRDLKKKRGVSVKLRKRKKMIFTETTFKHT